MKKNIESNKKYALQVINYTKKFGGFTAVENVNMGVGHGKIHGFIGPNGAGKTTTIKAIIGAYYKSAGEIWVEGFKAGSIKAKKRIGYIPERASFPQNMTCMEYLVAMAELSGFSAKESHKKALSILGELGLLKHKHRKPNLFSSGMKKKIIVAQALMIDPIVLVLDEPAANLDPTARKDLFDLFKKIVKRGCSILISSHILTELQYIIDEVTFISQGKVRFSGKVSDLTLKNGFVATFSDQTSSAAKAFIKKHKLEETTSGWKKTTATTQAAYSIVKEALNNKISLTSISFLGSNLVAAYDQFVLEHGRESGVSKAEQKAKKPLFNFEPKINTKTKKGGTK